MEASDGNIKHHVIKLHIYTIWEKNKNNWMEMTKDE